MLDFFTTNLLKEKRSIMSVLAIIPCGKRKLWDKYSDAGEVEVSSAYIGVLHRLCQQYAKQFCDQWVILSGLHGFKLPHDYIPCNYDVTFGMKEKQDQIISISDLKEQVKQKELDQFDRIIGLTGKKHMPYIDQSFPSKVVYPLMGTKGIGEIQQKLKQAILENRPLH